MDNRYKLLRDVFGYSSFREGQEPLIDAILEGRDVFGVMPTGGGKSMCYQLPALMLPGVTLVISPLISLMADQVTALRSMGVDAATVNSSQDFEEGRSALRRARSGALRLLYVSPERLEGEGFGELFRSIDVSLIAVDEAHCISQWGQDFRPSYLRIPQFIDRLPHRPPVAAFTATATPQVREDVEMRLGLRDPLRIFTGFDRPNLRFEVLSPKNKFSALIKLLTARRGKSGIIYCSTRKNVETVCEKLQAQGFLASRYHAGLEDGERRANQDDFLYDRKPIMVATNAFGMGIDKSNVSFVIHYNMPKSMEAYYQEAGRAGRDGAPADCVLLYSPGDVATARFLIESGEDNPELTPAEQKLVRKRDYERLGRMVDYCETKKCLRGCILDYFGQSHGESCGNCGNCGPRPGEGDGELETVERDVTREGQMVLSCILRIHTRLGYYVGRTLVVQVLRGSMNSRVLSLGLDELTTFSLMKGTEESFINEVFSALLDGGYLTREAAHGTVIPTAKARELLFDGGKLTIEQKRRKRKAKPKKIDLPLPKEEPEAFEPEDRDNELLEALKLLRLSIARREGVPLYVVFTNATLLEMVRLRPRTRKELLAVQGVGTVKAERYGELFLNEIRKYL